MTIKKCTPLLIEAGIDKKEGRNAKCKTWFVLPQFTNDEPDHNRAKPAPKQCEYLPIDWNLRKDMCGDLIEQAPHRTIRGEVTRQRLCTQLITNPRHRQVVPVKAQLGNRKSVCAYGNNEQKDRWIQFSHVRTIAPVNLNVSQRKTTFFATHLWTHPLQRVCVAGYRRNVGYYHKS